MQKEGQTVVLWFHAYYWKEGPIWAAKYNQASWCVQKIMKASKYLEQTGTTLTKFLGIGKFSIRIYTKLRGFMTRYPGRE